MYPLRNEEVEASLSVFRQQFFALLERENIPVEMIKSYKLIIERLGNRLDVIELRGQPELIDTNGKIYLCSEILTKYPEPI